MICDSCIHKEVCYELEEDRQALKHCSDYFNFEEELGKIKTEADRQGYYNKYDRKMIEHIIDNHIEELKGE